MTLIDVAVIGLAASAFVCGLSLGGRLDRWLCQYRGGIYRPRYGWPRELA